MLYHNEAAYGIKFISICHAAYYIVNNVQMNNGSEHSYPIDVKNFRKSFWKARAWQIIFTKLCVCQIKKGHHYISNARNSGSCIL